MTKGGGPAAREPAAPPSEGPSRGVIAATAFFALASWGLSLSWPVIHDLPILLYEGFLVAEAGLVPYRDFFEFNPPGTVLLFSWLHQATGGAQPAIRLVDFLVLAAIVAATCSALSRFGARAGIFAGASFTAAYLATGPLNNLQREFLCVLPLALSIALVFRAAAGGKEWLVCGLSAGLVFTVKPPLAICWLPLLVHAVRRARGGGGGWSSYLRPPAFFAGGALPPLVLVLLWLDRNAALAPYLEIVREYYPLYTQLGFDGVLYTGSMADLFERYVGKTLAVAAKPLAFPAILGVAAALASKEGKERSTGTGGENGLAAQAAALGGVAGGKEWLVCGLSAGLVFTVKPPLAICWLPLLVHAVRRARGGGGGWSSYLRPPAFFAGGALPPLVLVLLWLDRNAALAPYLEIVREYYPLYTQLGFDGVLYTGSMADLFERYVGKTLAVAAKPLAFPAILGVAAALASKEGKERSTGTGGENGLAAQAAALGGVAVCALAYVPIGGKFWLYHQIPFFYAISLCAALLVGGKVAPPGGWRGRQVWLLAAALAACLPYGEFAGHFRQWRSGMAAENVRLQVLPMADYLRGQATAADSVLPLDTAAGAAHALYLARRPLYGRFLYDFHFYHHQESSYLAGLRRLFLDQFAGGRPSLIVSCRSWRPSVKGEAPVPFRELDELLAADYREELRAGDCRVLRRRN